MGILLSDWTSDKPLQNRTITDLKMYRLGSDAPNGDVWIAPENGFATLTLSLLTEGHSKALMGIRTRLVREKTATKAENPTSYRDHILLPDHNTHECAIYDQKADFKVEKGRRYHWEFRKSNLNGEPLILKTRFTAAVMFRLDK